MSTNGKRSWWRVGGIIVCLLLLASAVLVFAIKRRIPPGLSKDIRAGIAARNISDPDQRVQRYLELRYGPLADPANRQKVFMDFFDLDHIKALQLIVKHSPEAPRQGNVLAMARWVEQYRNSLTPQERVALKTQLQGAGLTKLRQATAQYNFQDARYRGQTAPVISQLLTTIASLQTQ